MKNPGKAKKETLEDYLPPHSLDAEQGVLGCCIVAPEEAIVEAAELLKEEDFYDLRHKIIFRELLAMMEAGQGVDSITLLEWFKRKSLLDDVGGLGYVVSLADVIPSAVNLPNYVEIVREKALLREATRICADSLLKLRRVETDPSIDSKSVLSDIERDLLKLCEKRSSAKERSIRELMRGTIDRLEEYHRGKAQMQGLSTGFEYLDKMVLGLRGGEMYVFAARPGMGKTSLLMNIVDHVAVELQQPVGIFSLEMTGESLSDRWLFQRARADFQRFRTGYLINEDVPKLVRAAGEIANAPVWVDDAGGMLIDDLRTKARRMARQYGVKLFVIDYLQLLHSSRHYHNRNDEVAEISGKIKALTKELGLPFIVLGQLNRELEKNPNRLPQMSDLRESGSLEQDADLVGFLYDPKIPEKMQEEHERKMFNKFGSDWAKTAKRVNFLISKQRNGPTGIVELLFLKYCMRYESAHGELSTGPQVESSRGPAPPEDLPSNDELGFGDT